MRLGTENVEFNFDPEGTYFPENTRQRGTPWTPVKNV